MSQRFRAVRVAPRSHAFRFVAGRVCPAAFFVLAVVAASTVAADGYDDHPAVLANQSVKERWLFAHPSWLQWWILPNWEKTPDFPRLITGVFCVFVETPSGHDSVALRDEVESRTRALGLDFVFGRRHAHGRGEVTTLPFDPTWHRAMVRELRAARSGSWVIDSEPQYFDRRRYNGASEAPKLFVGCEPWRHLGPGRLFVYPAGPEYFQFQAVAAHATAGGTQVFALDSATYAADRRKDVITNMKDRSAFEDTQAFGYGVTYVPGMFFEFALDEAIMREVARSYGRCWFFPRTRGGHIDDLPNFGRNDWKWLVKLPPTDVSTSTTSTDQP